MDRRIEPQARFRWAIVLISCLGTLPAVSVTLVDPQSPLPSVVAGPEVVDRDAATELALYLSRVSGRSITVSAAPGAEGVVIHVGRDAFVQEHVPGIAGLFADGFVMQLRHSGGAGDSGGRAHLVLAGGRGHGTRWAVEQFLIEHCGVRWLFPDPEYGQIVPSRPTIIVPDDLSVRSEPDYVGRANCGMYYFTPDRKYLRLRPQGTSHGSHEIQTMFSTAEFATHPEWFALFGGKRQWWKYGNGWQICTTEPAAVARAVSYVRARFRDDPARSVVSVGQNDGNGWCECGRCQRFLSGFEPPYDVSDRWFHWVNAVARRVRTHEPDKWVEAMAYAGTSTPPRFGLEPNVAVTKTFVLDSEFDLAERWGTVCRSVNLYSYMYGASFMGFRHYPHAAADFLKWGREELGALAHVTECGGDWTFDGPKYHYLQALQWDVDADVDAVMRDFCAASYGRAAAPMRAFWDRLEAIYERRPPTPYGERHKRLLFYQWVSWGMSSYQQPNDEFVPYRLDDVAYLDDRMATALRLAAEDAEAVRFRVDRMRDAWRYYRTMVVSVLKYYPMPLEIAVATGSASADALSRARAIAVLRGERRFHDQQMLRYAHINPRRAARNFWSWGEALTLFSHENALIDELCTAVSAHHRGDDGVDAAVALWRRIPDGDPLHEHARTQLAMLGGEAQGNLLTNGGFESGTLDGWEVLAGGATLAADVARTGDFAVRCSRSGNNTIAQRVPVEPLGRYRLTAWAKHETAPPTWAAPMDARLEFYSGSGRVWPEPTRCVWRSTDPADGWVRLRSTMTIPPGVDAVRIRLTRRFSAAHLWDDITFERIRPGPPVTHGFLADGFDGGAIDREVWAATTDHRNGPFPPAPEDGWLVFRRERHHPLISLARFDDLLGHAGDQRYRLRFHVATLAGLPAEETVFAFGIKSGTGPISTRDTGMFWYLYFTSGKRAKALLSGFAFQSHKRTGGMALGLGGLKQPVTDLWCTLVFDPHKVVIHASTEGYDETAASRLGEFAHGITDLTANGSVFLKLGAGNQRLDDISVRRPGHIPAGDGPAPVDAPADADPKRLMMPGVNE